MVESCMISSILAAILHILVTVQFSLQVGCHKIIAIGKIENRKKPEITHPYSACRPHCLH